MFRHDNRQPAFDELKLWWQRRVASIREFAENVGADVTARGDATIDLLLIRMESLDLDSAEVKHIAPATFFRLANSCVSCECKERCERDLAYDSAGMATRGWETYCPNAANLKAMTVLPWFGNDRSRN